MIYVVSSVAKSVRVPVDVVVIVVVPTFFLSHVFLVFGKVYSVLYFWVITAVDDLTFVA